MSRTLKQLRDVAQMRGPDEIREKKERSPIYYFFKKKNQTILGQAGWNPATMN